MTQNRKPKEDIALSLLLNYDCKMNVVGLGQCALDYLFVVDSFPLPDTKKEVIGWTVCGGGPVATALVSLSRLGVNCSFHGIVGDDESGKKIEESLKIENVDVQGLLKRSKSNSQIAFIVVEKESGKRTIFWKRPSGEFLKPEEIPDNLLDNADFLLLDGLMVEASIYAAKKARGKNIPVMLDAGKIREGMIELASMCDYIVASEEFGKELIKVVPTPRDRFQEDNYFSFKLGNDPRNRVVPTEMLRRPENALLRMKSFGAKASTITLGENGSVTITGDKIFHIPAFKVDVIDTTGAGDVFHGGYIYGLLQKWDIKDVVRFTTAFASLKCRKLGGRAGIPSLEEVEALIKK